MATHLTKFSYFKMLRVMRNDVQTLKPCFAPLVMVSHLKNQFKYISGHTVFLDGSNDTTFDPTFVLLDSTC